MGGRTKREAGQRRLARSGTCWGASALSSARSRSKSPVGCTPRTPGLSANGATCLFITLTTPSRPETAQNALYRRRARRACTPGGTCLPGRSVRPLATLSPPMVRCSTLRPASGGPEEAPPRPSPEGRTAGRGGATRGTPVARVCSHSKRPAMAPLSHDQLAMSSRRRRSPRTKRRST